LDNHIAFGADADDVETGVRRRGQDLEDERITLKSTCPEPTLTITASNYVGITCPKVKSASTNPPSVV